MLKSREKFKKCMPIHLMRIHAGASPTTGLDRDLQGCLSILKPGQRWERAVEKGRLQPLWPSTLPLRDDHLGNFVSQFSSVQSLSRVRLFAIPWAAARQASLSITNSEFTQTHVHRVTDAIQPSSPTFNLSQHQGLFQWVSSSHQVAKVLEFQLQLQHQSFQWIFRTDFL